MARTHTASSGELVTISPDDPRGPWTIELPDPQASAANNGWFVVVKAIEYGDTPVTITCLGTASIEEPDLGAKRQAVVVVLAGHSTEFTYNAARNTWCVYRSDSTPQHMAILYGQPDQITGNNQTLVNWNGELHHPFYGVPDTAAGTITVPYAGLYLAQAFVLCTQSNSTKEFQIVLRMDRTISGNIDIATFQVATDKTPRYRTFPFSSPIEFADNCVVSLSMRAEGDSFGNLTFADCSFSLTRLFTAAT